MKNRDGGFKEFSGLLNILFDYKCMIKVVKKHTGGGIEPLCISASSGFEVLTAHHELLTDAVFIPFLQIYIIPVLPSFLIIYLANKYSQTYTIYIHSHSNRAYINQNQKDIYSK